jgi:hypothetical protein
MGYGLNGQGSIPSMDKKCFSIPDRLWGPPSLLCNRFRGYFCDAKRQRREADHSPLSSAEVKNGGAITVTPPYVFIAW